jgi:predicted HicB family RNase H-like nuclease
MGNTLSYLGYDGSVEFDAEERILRGRLLGVRDAVTYEGSDVLTLELNFQAAVDDYLALCKERGTQPSQPFSGTFNVRTGADLHRRAALYAEHQQIKLNSVVKDALEKFLANM